MDDFKLIPTSAEVWAVIQARHSDDLELYSSFTRMSEGRIGTEYKLKGADFPFIRAITTWDVNPDKPSERENMDHRYWLCVPTGDTDD